MKIKSLLIFAVLVTAVLCFGGVASAQTTDNSALIAQLQAQIQALLQQITTLQNQQGASTAPSADTTTASAAPAWCYNFTKNMGYGAKGADYDALIKVLDLEGIAEFTSANKPAVYNSVIGNAVIKLQAKYKISKTGFFGSQIRAKINAKYKCQSASATILTNPEVTSTTPYIIGTATGVTQVGIVLSAQSGDKVYGSGLVPVTNGSWSVTVTPALAYGHYIIYVYDGNNNLLQKGPLNIVSPEGEGSFRNAYMACYDGSTSNMGDPTSCKPSSTWQTYAKQFCQDKCSPTTGKCGVNTFSVSNPCSGSAQPTITVLAPNGQDVWKVGEKREITWKTNNIPSPNDKMTIYIIPAGDPSKNYNLAQAIPNTGSYIYTVDDPAKFSSRSPLYQAGGQFRIFVCAQASGSADLCSYARGDSATFTIAAASTCTPNWQCGTWSTCISPKQLLADNITQVQKQISQTTDPTTLAMLQAMLANMQAQWQTASSTPQQNRSCTDTNNCGTTVNQPATTQTCTVSQSALTVTSPNGGEKLVIGKVHEITWNKGKYPDLNVVIGIQDTNYYSGYVGITNAIPNTGSYKWTVALPEILTGTKFQPDSNYRISIGTAYNTNGYYESDTSDAPFSIVASTQLVTTSSAVIVGSQSAYTAGQTIKFSVKAVISDGLPGVPEKGFNVQYRLKDDVNTVVINGVYQTGNATYNYATGYWDVATTAPSDTSKTYTATASFYCSWSKPGYCDAENKPGQIDKTFTFTVTSNTTTKPTITVTSPNGGETWKVGETRSITWTSSNLSGVPGTTSNVLVQLRNVTNAWTYPLDTVSANAGSYSWKIPAVLTSSNASFTVGEVGKQYQIVVNQESLPNYVPYNGAMGTSDSFEISPASSTQPSITVTSPNGGETWKIYETHAITWNSSGMQPNTTVRIDLENPEYPAGVVTIDNVSNTGNYNWNITLPTSSQGDPYKYKIKVTSYSVYGNVISDESDNYFTIAAANALPTISMKINGSTATGTAGATNTLSWTTTNTTSCVASSCQYDPSTNRSPSCDGLSNADSAWLGSVATSGSRSISPTKSPTTAYVLNCSGNGGSATSSILSYPPISVRPSITLTSPNGGETWTQGSTHEITWTATGIPSTARASIALAIGNMAYSFVSPLASVGHYTWTIPAKMSTVATSGTIGNQMKIRIMSIYPDPTTGKNTYQMDSSDNYFSITAPSTASNVSESSLGSISDALNAIAQQLRALMGQ